MTVVNFNAGLLSYEKKVLQRAASEITHTSPRCRTQWQLRVALNCSLLLYTLRRL